MNAFLGAPKITFLDHIINKDSITPLPEKVNTIQNFPPPNSIRQLHRLIDLLNYYQCFIPNLSSILLLLTNLLQAKNKNISSQPEEMHALIQPNQLLLNSYLNSNEHTFIYLVTNASCSAVGTVIKQVSNFVQMTISFFSAKLTSTQTQYSTFSREVLAIYLVIKHFRHILEGRHFIIFTSHKPLTQAMHSNSQTYNP